VGRIGSLGAMLLVALVATGAMAGLPASPSAATSSGPYYLALGDSLSTGGGATPGNGYVEDIYAQARARIPGLQLENLGCGGDSTTRMIRGGLCHNYTTGNQLGDAEAFLRAHPGQVSFVTIDVGGDDVVGCALSGTIDPTCVANAAHAIGANLPVILSGLRSAGGDVPIVGMTYYDPILAAWYSGAWFQGPTGPATARASVSLLRSLNDELSGLYAQYGIPVANVQRPFQSSDWKLTGAYLGQNLPQNVADICNWTHMCMTGGGNPNIHATDYGHSLIASAFEKVLRVPPTISGAPGPASLAQPYAYQFTVGGIPSAAVKRSGSLPKGLALLPSGLLSGTPTKAGSFSMVLTARNSAGSASLEVTIVVS
jgi:lysophospholipase L1-like esterase